MSANSALPGDRRSHCREAVVARAIAQPTCRAALTVLEERGGSIEVETLARAVATETTDEGLEGSPAPERGDYHLLLYHSTLPRLASLGLVDWDPEAGTAELADTSSIRALGVDVASLDEEDAVPWDALATVLATPRRKATVSVLAAGDELTIHGLAVAVAAEVGGVPPAERPAEEVTETAIALRHVDLPKLAEVGLIEEGWDDGPIVLRDDRLAQLPPLDAVRPAGSGPGP